VSKDEPAAEVDPITDPIVDQVTDPARDHYPDQTLDPAAVPGLDPNTPVYGRVRRAPRYGSFVATGAILGVVLGIVLSFSRPSTGDFSQNSVVGYVAAILGLIGALIGGALAVLMERRRR
jgi:hypothetical protein